MADNTTFDINDDPFGDVFGGQAVTPDLNSFKTTGTNKLLVVIFVVDCSRSMEGERIMAVNAALQEVKSTLQDIKNDNGIDLKIAIMSFTSSARWELNLTDIDEVSLENLCTRPGLTEYGNAFHELNKVLRREEFMKHTGKIAPPAIMFLTDGGPTDDYDSDLDDLLKNGWFKNASRSAVLLGDAINNEDAKRAVERFVENSATDIVDADNSTVIIQKVKLATMHTVAGEPMDDVDSGNAASTPFNDPQSAGLAADAPVDDPFGAGTAASAPVDDPFGAGGAVNAPSDDPFAVAGDSDPFAGAADSDPFATSAGSDPFATSAGGDPFGGAGGSDPFGDLDGNDPFGGMA